MSERDHHAPALAYQRVSDGAWFCRLCLWRWLEANPAAPGHCPCWDVVVLQGKLCRDCGRLLLRTSVEEELVTAYDDPLAWATSDGDWW